MFNSQIKYWPFNTNKQTIVLYNGQKTSYNGHTTMWPIQNQNCPTFFCKHFLIWKATAAVVRHSLPIEVQFSQCCLDERVSLLVNFVWLELASLLLVKNYLAKSNCLSSFLVTFDVRIRSFLNFFYKTNSLKKHCFSNISRSKNGFDTFSFY